MKKQTPFHSRPGNLTSRLINLGWFTAEEPPSPPALTPKGRQALSKVKETAESLGLHEPGVSLTQFTRELRRESPSGRAVMLPHRTWILTLAEAGLLDDGEESDLGELVQLALLLSGHEAEMPYIPKE